MQNRIYSASNYAALFRAAVPAVVGTLGKLINTDIGTLHLYENSENCASGYPIEPFHTMNNLENSVIKHAGLIEPETAALFFGAVVSAILAETDKLNALNYLTQMAKKTLTQFKEFAFSINKKDLTYAVILIGGALAIELANNETKKTYHFDASGHFKTAVKSTEKSPVFRRA